MNATQINQYINHDELCACRRWVRTTRPACDCGASEAQESVRRAVNSHEAAQRLAEAAESMLYIFDRDLPEGSIGKLRCNAIRAALAEWEAVK